jgi:hypothetical protein
MANTFELIQATTLGSAQATITLSSIPSTYTDLCLKLSLRYSSANDRRIIFFKFNGVTSGYDDISIRGFNDNVASQTDNGGNTSFAVWDMPAAEATTSTFSNVEIYIPNYAGSTNKSVSADGVGENNNSTGVVLGLTGASSTITSAISQIDIFGDGTGNFVQYSTAYLFGIKSS